MQDATRAVQITPERARSLAEEILARPEYARFRREPGFLQSQLDKLAAWLERAWDFAAGLVPGSVADGWWALWSGLQGALAGLFGGDGLTALMRLVLAAAVFAIAALLLRRVLREVRQRRVQDSDDDVLHPQAGPDLMAEAERHARHGRFLDAAHCVQLAALQLLLRKKCIELARSDPNRTLRRRLADAPLPAGLRDGFVAGLDRLEGQWFRDRREDRELYGQWRALHDQIQALPEAR